MCADIAAWQDPDDSDGEGVPTFQVVLELDMETWKVGISPVLTLCLAHGPQEAIRVFDIKKSVIPHRDYEQPASLDPNKWYA